MDTALAAAERLNSISLLRNTLLNFVAYTLAAGDFDRSAALVDQARQVLGHADDPATRARLAIREAEVCEAQGDIGAALASARTALQYIEDNKGGLPDYWPWRLLSRLLWNCGEREAAIDTYGRLPQSPAWQPRAEVAVEFFTTVYRLPYEADAVLPTLALLEPEPGMICSQQMIDFHRAFALHLCNRHDEALRLLMPDGEPLQVSPFEQHRAQLVALQLMIEAALGSVSTEQIQHALALIPVTSPFEQLALHLALGQAARVAGDANTETRHFQASEALLDRLAASLADSNDARPDRLRDFWRGRWQGAPHRDSSTR